MISRNNVLVAACSLSLAGNVFQAFLTRSLMKDNVNIIKLLLSIMKKHGVVLDEFDLIALSAIADYYPESNGEGK
jgi:hypothetical protein